MSDIDLDAIYDDPKEEHVDRLVVEVRRLRDENRLLRVEAAGLTVDGRTVPELEARIRELEAGIQEHRDETTCCTEHADALTEDGTSAGGRLWSLLPEDDTDG